MAMSTTRVFSPKCLVGNWLEDRKAPQFEGVRPSAQTEMQIRNLATTGVETPTFGAALRSTYSHIKSYEDKLDYDNLVYPDTRYTGATWASVTASTHFGAKGGIAADSKDFSGSYKMGGGAFTRDPVALAAYRERWQVDSRGASAVSERFGTTNNRSVGAAAPDRFQPSPSRFLPGVVRAIDVLREKALEKHGMDGVLAIALALPQTFTRLSFRSALESKLGLRLTVDQESELLRFLAPPHGEGTSYAADLIAAMLGHPMTETRRAAIERAWATLEKLAALQHQSHPPSTDSSRLGMSRDLASGPAPPVTLATLAAAINPAMHPDARGKGAIRKPESARARVLEGAVAALLLTHSAPQSQEDEDAHASPAAGMTARRGAGAAALSPARGGALAATLSSTSASAALSPRHSGDDAEEDVPGQVHWGPGVGAGRMVELPWDHVPLSIDLAAPPNGPATVIARAAWDAYCTFLSAGVDSDDAFGRTLDGLLHLGSRPVIAALAPRLTLASPGLQGATATLPPRRDGGVKTAYSDIGAGLGFSSAPLLPHVRPAPPVPVPRTDADVATLDGTQTHLLVVVTHADGRKSLQKLPQDRYLGTAAAAAAAAAGEHSASNGAAAGASTSGALSASGPLSASTQLKAAATLARAANTDKEGLLLRLAAMGIYDAVDAVVDF